MAFAAPSLKGRALRLLSQREHSRAELERKLAAYEEEPGTLARALDELESRGFISEARVVQSVLYQRAARLGGARIRQELQAKGIQPEAVAEAVQGLQESELARAQALWQRRFDRVPADAKEHARQMRFLLTRGFAAETAGRVLRTARMQAREAADESADGPAA